MSIRSALNGLNRVINFGNVAVCIQIHIFVELYDDISIFQLLHLGIGI